MKITNKDPFYISLVKGFVRASSGATLYVGNVPLAGSLVKGFVRASSGAALLMGNVPLAGLLLIAAEILGVAVAEEL
jgi:hypothetical protein